MRTRMYARTSTVGLFLVVLACVVPKAATSREEPKDRLVNMMVGQAWKDVERFNNEGGQPEDPGHPARTWSDILWQYHDAHHSSPVAEKAARAALNLLLQVDADAAAVRIQTLGPEDPFWLENVAGLLMRIAQKKNDYGFLLEKTRQMFEQTQDPQTQAALWLLRGHAYWEQKELGEAKTAFYTVIQHAPESRYADKAQRNLFEINRLNAGQPAPNFAVQTTEGTTFSLADLRGKVVLLDFWATWCYPCLQQFPELKKLKEDYEPHGLLILGISLDENVQAFEKVTARYNLSWPQVCEGKGLEDSELARLFNIRFLPMNYLLGPEGFIVAKNVHGDTLRELISKTLNQ